MKAKERISFSRSLPDDRRTDMTVMYLTPPPPKKNRNIKISDICHEPNYIYMRIKLKNNHLFTMKLFSWLSVAECPLSVQYRKHHFDSLSIDVTVHAGSRSLASLKQIIQF